MIGNRPAGRRDHDSEEHPCIPYQVVDLCEALRSATVGRRSCTSTILETRSELQQRNHKFHSILNDHEQLVATTPGTEISHEMVDCF